MTPFRSVVLSIVLIATIFVEATVAGELLPPGVTEDSLSAEPALVRLAAQPILYIPLTTVRNTPESSALISSSFDKIWAFAKSRNIKTVGSPMEIMSSYQDSDGSWRLWAAVPFALPENGVNQYRDAGEVKFGELEAGEAIQAAHRGDHGLIQVTHERIVAFAKASGRAPVGKIVEQHFDSPHTNPPEKLRSSVTYFLK